MAAHQYLARSIAIYIGLWPLVAASGFAGQWILNFGIFLYLALHTQLVRHRMDNAQISPLEVASLFVLSLLVLWMCGLDLMRGAAGSSFARSFLFLSPFLLVFCHATSGEKELFDRRFLLLTVSISCISNLIFTFVLSSYDARIGKFHGNIPGFELSSNTLSFYLVMSFVIPAWVLFGIVKKNLIALMAVTMVPFIHFSKAHLFAYVASIGLAFAVASGRLVHIMASAFIAIIIVGYVGGNADYFRSVIPDSASRSLGSIVLAFEIIYMFLYQGAALDIFIFLTEVGDANRSFIYRTLYEYFSEYAQWGMSEKDLTVRLRGWDVHNVFAWFATRYGVTSTLMFLLLVFIPLFDSKVDKVWRFILVFAATYLTMRVIFISHDPIRILFYMLLLYIMAKSSCRTKLPVAVQEQVR